MLYGLDTLGFAGVDLACLGYLLNGFSEVILFRDRSLKDPGNQSVLLNADIDGFFCHVAVPFIPAL
jgi:hypothetical protein